MTVTLVLLLVVVSPVPPLLCAWQRRRTMRVIANTIRDELRRTASRT